MKYCTCQDSWKYFKIVDMDIQKPRIQIRFQSLGKNKTTLLEMSRSCDLPDYLYNTNFEFCAKEHVRIEVHGGKITLIGASHVGSFPTKILNDFILSCPFSDFDKN